MTPEWIPHRIKLAVLVIVLGGLYLLFRIWVVCYATVRLEHNLSQIDTGPGPSSADDEDAFEILVHVAEDGSITVNDEGPVTDLLAALERLGQANPWRKAMLTISCDEKASYDRVVTVMNQISKAGIKNVTFTVGAEEF